MRAMITLNSNNRILPSGIMLIKNPVPINRTVVPIIRLSLITITHDLQEVVQAERVIVMNEGEIWEEAAPRDIFSQKNELTQIGLDVPFVAKLAEALKEKGIPLTKEPLNHEELLEDLWTLHSKT